MPIVEIIQSLERLDEFKTKWNELLRRAKLNSPFLSHQWFRACVRSLSPHQELLILALLEGQELIGVAPLLRERILVRGLPVERLGFVENPLSPFADFLLVEPESGLNLVLEHLFRVYTNWDILTLNRFREDSPNLNLFCSLLSSHGATYHRQVTSRTPYLQIDRPWDEFYKLKSRKFRMTRRSVANRVQRLGNIAVEQVSSRADATAALEQMFAVSARSWKTRERRDLLHPAVERVFFTELSSGEQPDFRLWLLKNGEQTLATEFHLEHDGVVYGLRAHYDDAFSWYSPGSYLDFEIVQHLFQNGYSCYDMGPGISDYKMAWTESAYTCYKIEVYNRKVYSQFLSRLQHKWIPAMKQSPVARWMQRA